MNKIKGLLKKHENIKIWQRFLFLIALLLTSYIIRPVIYLFLFFALIEIFIKASSFINEKKINLSIIVKLSLSIIVSLTVIFFITPSNCGMDFKSQFKNSEDASFCLDKKVRYSIFGFCTSPNGDMIKRKTFLFDCIDSFAKSHQNQSYCDAIRVDGLDVEPIYEFGNPSEPEALRDKLRSRFYCDFEYCGDEFNEIFLNSENASFCFENNLTTLQKSDQYFGLAFKTASTYCRTSNDYYISSPLRCVYSFAKYKNNISFCNELVDFSLIHEPSSNLYNSSTYKDDCIWAYVTSDLDPLSCELLSNEEKKRDICLKVISWKTGDASLCEKIIDNNVKEICLREKEVYE